MLDEDDYKVSILQLIAETKAEYFGHIPNQILFDLIKLRIKEETIHYCVKRSKYLKCENDYLEKALENLDNKLQLSTDMALKIKLQEKRNLIKKKLDRKFYDITHAAFVRSQSKWIEQGKKVHSVF